MDLINPFEEPMSFGKAATTPPQSSTTIRALVPTGRHVGHGQDLTHVRGPKSPASGTLLEHYRGKKTKQVVQPVGKSAKRSLEEILERYRPTSVPKAQKQSARVKGGTLAGRQDVTRRHHSMESLRSKVFQDGSSSGRRIG